jgi:guanylate kinase
LKPESLLKKNQNFLIILSAPSGGGKTTILQEVLKRHQDVEYSISYTTRPPRGDEENGRHYHFVDEKEFLRRREAGDFLETALVFDRWYGTSLSFIKSRLSAGKHVIMDIDVQGAAQIHPTSVPCVKIFILPPTLEILRQRLIDRDTDAPQEIEKRLKTARKELEYIPDYEYLVENDDLDLAVQKVLAIIQAEENRIERYPSPAADFLKTEKMK